MGAARIRVGAVNYLNTKPLVEGLTGFAPEIDLSFDLPSRLADRSPGEANDRAGQNCALGEVELVNSCVDGIDLHRCYHVESRLLKAQAQATGP